MGNYVALSTLKDALGITGSGDDTFLNLSIDSTEELIDDLCGRSFIQDSGVSAKTFRAQPYYAEALVEPACRRLVHVSGLRRRPRVARGHRPLGMAGGPFRHQTSGTDAS